MNSPLYPTDDIDAMLTNPCEYVYTECKRINVRWDTTNLISMIEQIAKFIVDPLLTEPHNTHIIGTIELRLHELMMTNQNYQMPILMLINEYFIENSTGSFYNCIFNIIFWVLVYAARITLIEDRDPLNKTSEKFSTMLTDHISYIKMFIFSGYYSKVYEDLAAIPNKADTIQTIIDILDKNETIIIPFAQFGHQMSFVLRKFSNGLYKVYFNNSGEGTVHHIQILLNYNIYVKAVKEYNLPISLFRLFLTSFLYNPHFGSADDFYASIIYQLEAKNLSYANAPEVIRLREAQKTYEPDNKYYYPAQAKGNCAFRAFLLPLQVYSKLICTTHNNFDNELVILLRCIVASIIMRHNIPQATMAQGPFDRHYDITPYMFVTYIFLSLKQQIAESNLSDVPQLRQFYATFYANYAILMQKYATNANNLISLSITDENRYRIVDPINMPSSRTAATHLNRLMLPSYFREAYDLVFPSVSISTLFRIDDLNIQNFDAINDTLYNMLSCRTASATYVTFDIHNIKRLIACGVCCNILKQCFGLPSPNHASNILKNYFGNMMYLNSVFYEDMANILNNCTEAYNMIHKNMYLFDNIDYFSDDMSDIYENILKTICDDVSVSLTNSSSIEETRLKPENYEVVILTSNSSGREITNFTDRHMLSLQCSLQSVNILDGLKSYIKVYKNAQINNKQRYILLFDVATKTYRFITSNIQNIKKMSF